MRQQPDCLGLDAFGAMLMKSEGEECHTKVVGANCYAAGVSTILCGPVHTVTHGGLHCMCCCCFRAAILSCFWVQRLGTQTTMPGSVEFSFLCIASADMCIADLCAANICIADKCNADTCIAMSIIAMTFLPSSVGAAARTAITVALLANTCIADICAAEICTAETCIAEICIADMCVAMARGVLPSSVGLQCTGFCVASAAVHRT